MGIGLMPGGNWHFFIVATTAVAFFLAWFALILNRKNKQIKGIIHNILF